MLISMMDTVVVSNNCYSVENVDMSNNCYSVENVDKRVHFFIYIYGLAIVSQNTKGYQYEASSYPR